jgi:signal transduction histidine kinase/integral membrane sensor domain MASE1
MKQPAHIARIGLLAALYVATAKLGIELEVAHGVITPVWIPSGLSLAALILFGYSLWPGVALGALIANATSDVNLGLAVFIAAGNTLEAVVGTFLLKRAGFDRTLRRARDVLAFVILGAFVATAVAATNGVATLSIGGAVPDDPTYSWFLWWFGDAIGVLLVTPALLAWFGQRWRDERSGSLGEGLLLVVLLGVASSLVFLGGSWRYPYVVIPLLVWATLRFKDLGAATAILIVGAIGTIGTIHGAVPIGGATPTQGVQILQALIAVVGVSMYMIAASLCERDDAQEELAAAHAALADAQAISHLGSWEWDIVANRVSWSDEMYRIYGYEPQEFPVTFEKAMERVIAEDHPRVAQMLEREFATGIDHANPDLQYRIVLPDGRERALLGKGTVQFDKLGQPQRLVGTVEDITELLEHQEAMMKALQLEQEAGLQLKELDQVKNTFMSAVSHDLRGPLTTMGALAEVLTKRLDALSHEEVVEALGRIADGAVRADRVLTNLLDLDRISRGAVEAARSEVDLGDLASRVALALDSEGRRIELPGDHVSAWVDEGLTERILENLVVNSIRHTPSDARIWIRVSREGNDTLLSVEDDGPGVPEHLRRTIFEAFQRGETRAGGTGIGLYLIAQFAELHGGRAWVEERDGGGAAFRVLFPDSGMEAGNA